MSQELTIECTVHVGRRGHGARKELRHGPAPKAPPLGRVPRAARLLALAHRMDAMVKGGEVKDFAELARLGRVTRARMSQVMSLLYLAPDIQETILHLPKVAAGRDPIILRDLLPIAMLADWRRQRRVWRQLADDANSWCSEPAG